MVPGDGKTGFVVPRSVASHSWKKLRNQHCVSTWLSRLESTSLEVSILVPLNEL